MMKSAITRIQAVIAILLIITLVISGVGVSYIIGVPAKTEEVLSATGELTATVADLGKTVVELGKAVAELGGAVAGLTDTVKELGVRVAGVEEALKAAEERIAAAEKAIVGIEERIAAVEEAIKPPPPPLKAWELIKWDEPVSMAERIMGIGPIESIPSDFIELGKTWYGVDLSGRKGMLTGYVLPEGWEEATEGVEELVLTNSGSLKHDPATVLNALIFYKLTGIRLIIIEMKDLLLWPKTLSVLTAKATDIDVFYSTNYMFEVPHLSAAGWLHPVDELWPPEVQELYPEGLIKGLKGIDGRFYGSPFCNWGLYLFYRPSWLEAAGVKVPETWQELVTATKKVDDWAKATLGPGYSGMVFAAGDPDQLRMLWAMTTFAQGKTIMVDGRVVIDPESWGLITDLWLKGGLGVESLEYMWVDAPEVFAKGKAGFIITGGVYMKMYADPVFAGPIQGDWAVTLLPAWEDIGVRGRALAGNDAWTINPYIDPKKIAAAMLWLDFQRSFVGAFNELYVEGNEAVVKAVYDHPAVIAEVEFYDLRKETVAKQIGELYPPGMMEVMDVFKEYVHKVALGEIDPVEALTKAQEAIDLIV